MVIWLNPLPSHLSTWFMKDPKQIVILTRGISYLFGSSNFVVKIFTLFNRNKDFENMMYCVMARIWRFKHCDLQINLKTPSFR